jgi:spore coat protein U-like protein
VDWGLEGGVIHSRFNTRVCRFGPSHTAAALALLGAALLARPVAAADCSATATSINFGIYDSVTPVANDSTGTLTVSCTHAAGGGQGSQQVSYTVALSSGSGVSPTTRWLAAGPFRLYYNLYRDAARTQVWGDGTAGSYLQSGTLRVGPGVGNRTRTAAYTVYGRMPALQDAAAGDYADLIVFTLTF